MHVGPHIHMVPHRVPCLAVSLGRGQSEVLGPISFSLGAAFGQFSINFCTVFLQKRVEVPLPHRFQRARSLQNMFPLFLCWCRLVRMPLRSRIFSCWLRRQPVSASPVASRRLTTILAPKAPLGLDCHISIAHVGCFWLCFSLSPHGSQGVSPGARWPFQPQVDISVPSCLGALVGQGDGQERHSASLCRWFWPQMFEIEVHCKPLRGDSGRGSARLQTAPAILSLGRSLSGSAGPVGLGPENLGTVAVSCSESHALVSQGFAGVGLLQSELVAVIHSRPWSASVVCSLFHLVCIHPGRSQPATAGRSHAFNTACG